MSSAAASTIDELLAHNRNLPDTPVGRREATPSRAVAIVTCMDARIDLGAALGLGAGEAHVLRNAGAAITEDVLRSLTLSQRRLGTREVMVIKHTDCGAQGLDEDDFIAELRHDAGATPEWAIGSFTDLDASVREAVGRVRSCPFLAHRDRVRGFVYDVATARVREVGVD